MNTRMSGMSGLVLVLLFGCIVLNCCAVSNEETVISPLSDDVVMRAYLRRLYETRPYVLSLQTGESFAKRAAVLPYSGGFYGKRAPALPYSGGIYG